MTKPSLFESFVIENGTRRRATAAELKAAYRLWWRHKGIRLGRPRTSTTSSYKAVVWSHHWKQFSKAQKAVAEGCERCGRPQQQLEVHHLSYERAGSERPEDVLVVCKSCNRAVDRLRRRGRVPSVQITVADKRVVTREKAA